MGQQQLLLVILVTIIVGIATVVAINTFGSAADSANVDAVRGDVAQIAASAQGYYMKPTAMGGGSQSFSGITFDDLAFATDGDESSGATTVSNENGTYKIEASGTSGSQLTVTADPASGANYDGSSGSADNTLTATVTADGISYASQ